MHWKSFALGALVAYAAAVAAVSPLIRRDSNPPLDHEWDLIGLETARYYSDHGTMPVSTDFLPEPLRELVGRSGSGITWDAVRQRVTYNYPKAYPLNTPLMRLFTFGLIDAPLMQTTGSSLDLDSIRHNATIYQAAGLFDRP